MGRVKESGGGGIRIKNASEVKFYAESGVIESGNYIQFVRNGPLYGKVSQLTTDYYTYLDAIAVTDDRFLLYHKISNVVYLSLCKIEDEVVSVLHRVSVITHTSSYVSQYNYNASIAKLSENKYIITHTEAASNTKIYARIVTVSGDAITLGTSTLLTSNVYYGNQAPNSIAVLSEDKIIVPYVQANESTELLKCYYVVVLSVSGTTITVKKNVRVYTGEYILNITGPLSICAIDKNRAFFMFEDNESSKPYLYATIINVSDSYDVTTNDVSTIRSGAQGEDNYVRRYYEIRKISENKLIMAYNGASSTYPMQLRVVTINSDGTFSIGSTLSLGGFAFSNQYARIIVYDENTVIACARSTETADNMRAWTVRVNGTTCTIRVTYDLGYGPYSSTLLKLSGDRFLLMASEDASTEAARKGVWYNIITVEPVNVAKLYVNSVWGVSKTKATALKAGKAYLPKA